MAQIVDGKLVPDSPDTSVLSEPRAGVSESESPVTDNGIVNKAKQVESVRDKVNQKIEENKAKNQEMKEKLKKEDEQSKSELLKAAEKARSETKPGEQKKDGSPSVPKHLIDSAKESNAELNKSNEMELEKQREKEREQEASRIIEQTQASMYPASRSKTPMLKAKIRNILKDSGLDTQQQIRTYDAICEVVFAESD